MAEFRDLNKETSAFPSNPDKRGLDIIVRPLVSRDVEADVDLLLLTLGLERGSKILDLHCGEGSHALEMARRGMRVSAVGLHRQNFEAAQSTAVGESLDVTFLSLKGPELALRAEYYDGAIVNLGMSFSEAGTAASRAITEVDRMLVASAVQGLRSTGRLMLTAFHQDWLEGNACSGDWIEAGDTIELNNRCFQIMLHRSVFASSPRGSQALVPEGSALCGYRVKELEELLNSLGTRVISASGDLNGEPLASHHPMIFMVAKKEI